MGLWCCVAGAQPRRHFAGDYSIRVVHITAQRRPGLNPGDTHGQDCVVLWSRTRSSAFRVKLVDDVRPGHEVAEGAAGLYV